MAAREYLCGKTHLKSYREIERFMSRAMAAWGDRNVKAILASDIKNFLWGLHNVSDKTRHNYRSALHDFFTNYLVAEELLRASQVPRIPPVPFELGWRNLTDWPTQQAIMDELRKISWEINPKIWLGADLLRTYTSMRPGDLLKLNEGDIDLTAGILTVRQPTKQKNKQKTVRLLEDHVEQLSEVRSQFPALAAVPFFRHHGGAGNCRAGLPWGDKYLYRWWKRACAELGITDLDLYGGTQIGRAHV